MVVVTRARVLGACRVGLEVLKNNRRGRRLCESPGFTQAVYGPETGGSLYDVQPL